MQKMYRLLSVLMLAVCATRRPETFRELSECRCRATYRVAAAALRPKPPFESPQHNDAELSSVFGHFSVQLLSSEFKSETSSRRASTLNDP